MGTGVNTHRVVLWLLWACECGKEADVRGISVEGRSLQDTQDSLPHLSQ